jgi:hypothetical protein
VDLRVFYRAILAVGILVGASASQNGLSSPTEPKVSALTGFDPSRWVRMAGIRREWVRDDVTRESGGIMARRYGAPTDWGNPIKAFVWTKETWRDEWDCDSETKVIACLFPNGRVVDIRFRARDTRTSFYSAPASGTETEGQDRNGLGAEHEGPASQSEGTPK